MNTSPLSIEYTVARLRCRRIAPLLVPYADDRLRRAERERVEAHLDHCPTCRAEARTIAGVGALLRDEAMQTAAPVADLSPNLWANVEAEIRRSGVPLDRSAESPLLRPRRRAGLIWDAAWPNSVPVATAVFSAIVFGTVLLNHHELTAPTAPTASSASDSAKNDAAITVAIRPSAPAPALAASIGAPGAAAERRPAPLSFARAKTAEPQALRSFAAVGVHRTVPAASKGVLVAALPHPAAVTFFAAPKSATTYGLATAALRPVAPLAVAPASTATISSHGTAIAENGTLGAPTGVTSVPNTETPTHFADTARLGNTIVSDASTVTSAAAAKSTETLVATAGATALSSVTATDGAVSVSAAKPDDDATVRSGAPADQPMADFAAITRRQRSLFSYTSR